MSIEKYAESLIVGNVVLYVITGLLMFKKSSLAPIPGGICTVITILAHDNPWII